MAWRFNDSKYVEQGILDNRVPGEVFGRLECAVTGSVLLNLSGDMRGRLKGKRVTFSNPDYDPQSLQRGVAAGRECVSVYMQDFQSAQTGSAGDIMGDPYLYIEWYSRENGRCVIELEPGVKLTVSD